MKYKKNKTIKRKTSETFILKIEKCWYIMQMKHVKTLQESIKKKRVKEKRKKNEEQRTEIDKSKKNRVINK